MRETTTISSINNHVFTTLNNVTSLYSKGGMSKLFIDRAASIRIENLLEANSIKKFQSTIKSLEEELMRTQKQSYREILFSSTTRLIYLLTLDNLWDISTEAVINTLTNHIPIEETRTAHSDITKRKMLMSEDKISSISTEDLRKEKWLIAYCLIVMYLSEPLNVVRLDEYSDKS